jgi:hypothetical protein
MHAAHDSGDAAQEGAPGFGVGASLGPHGEVVVDDAGGEDGRVGEVVP